MRWLFQLAAVAWLLVPLAAAKPNVFSLLKGAGYKRIITPPVQSEYLSATAYLKHGYAHFIGGSKSENSKMTGF